MVAQFETDPTGDVDREYALTFQALGDVFTDNPLEVASFQCRGVTMEMIVGDAVGVNRHASGSWVRYVVGLSDLTCVYGMENGVPIVSHDEPARAVERHRRVREVLGGTRFLRGRAELAMIRRYPIEYGRVCQRAGELGMQGLLGDSGQL